MKSTYDIQDGVHVDIELGVVRVNLYVSGKITRSAIRHVRIHTDIATDFLANVHSMVRDAYETAAHGALVKNIFVTVQTPLTFFSEDTLVFKSKKEIPSVQTFVQEIEVTLPTYIVNTLLAHAQDGVLVQHAPQHFVVRGFEVPRETHVLGPYEVIQTLQWVTRSVYEAVRELAQGRGGISLVYVKPRIFKSANIIVGAYVTRLSVPHAANDIPIGIGEKSLLNRMSDTYDVPEVVIKSAFSAHTNKHTKNNSYTLYAATLIRVEVEKALRFVNMHSYQGEVTMHVPKYLEQSMRAATKPFFQGQLSTMNVTQ